MVVESRSLLSQGVDLIAHEQTTRFIRVLSAALAIMMATFAWDLIFRPDAKAFDNPVFDGVFDFATPMAWGVGFACSSLLLWIAAISGRAALHLLGVVVATVTLAGWSAMIMFEAWTSQEAVLTSGAVALYFGSFTSLIGLSLSPQPFEVEAVLVGVTEDDTVIPLRRIS